MVDINNTKQVDKKETTEMQWRRRRANHSTVSKPKYKEVKRKLCIYSNQIATNSAAEVEDIQFGFIKHSRKKDIIVPLIDHRVF